MSAAASLRLGFIPLVDCASLVVAQERGFFAAEGLEVALSREASWANIRDKVQIGLLDGAHMLGPMPLAMSLGAGGERTAMIAPMSLNLNGSAITVSRSLAEAMRKADPGAMAARPRTARALARLVEERRRRGGPAFRFATVFPFSMHAYELRYWLAEAGVDPDRDIRLSVIPPPRMTDRLKSGDIDGFCVGAPWSAVSVAEGSGGILVRGSEFWRSGPDKVFGVARSWAQANPEMLQAILRALLGAAAWADRPENRDALAAMLAQERYVGVEPALIRQSLDDIVFFRHAAAFPWRSHAAWFLSQMARWGQIPSDTDAAMVADAVYRPDLFRMAAASVGAPAPTADRKIEGARHAAWTLEGSGEAIAMAPDLFFDGRSFDPDNVPGYLGRFSISRMIPA
jgi:ABC-type nitrate/sulfonate/bicarbonate transport system substrate-binding protein